MVLILDVFAVLIKRKCTILFNISYPGDDPAGTREKSTGSISHFDAKWTL
jgi:hypothetical protein